MRKSKKKKNQYYLFYTFSVECVIYNKTDIYIYNVDDKNVRNCEESVQIVRRDEEGGHLPKPLFLYILIIGAPVSLDRG